MSGNLLDGMVGPTTQTIDSGKALAKFLGMEEELPESIALANGARLVLSKKRDCFYFVSEKGCTCRAGTYGRICRHRKPWKAPSHIAWLKPLRSMIGTSTRCQRAINAWLGWPEKMRKLSQRS